MLLQMIQSMDINTCKKICSLELNVLQLANAIISLTIPVVILKQAIVPALSHSNIIIRHEAILTLTTIFNQLQKYLSILKKVYKNNDDFCTFKNFLTEFIIKVYVILKNIN